MNKCQECKYASAVNDKPDFVRCNLRLPSWVASCADDLSGNRIVLRTDGCSFYEHPNAWMAQIAPQFSG